MTFKDFLAVMAIATAAAWIGWIVVLVGIDPARAGFLGVLFFYVSLSAALLGTLTLAGAGVRVWRHPEELVSRQVERAFRQAILFTLLLIGSLALLSASLLRWWSVLLLIFALGAVELAFLSSRPQRKSDLVPPLST